MGVGKLAKIDVLATKQSCGSNEER